MPKVLLVILLTAGSLSAGVMHLTLVDSAPREGATLAEAPREILLKFNEPLDPERRAISLRGPSGSVAVGPVRAVDSSSFAVSVIGAVSSGTYSVSWLAGAPDHATIRGRFRFTVAEGR